MNTENPPRSPLFSVEWIAPFMVRGRVGPRGAGEISQVQASLRAQRLVGFGIPFTPWKGVGSRIIKSPAHPLHRVCHSSSFRAFRSRRPSITPSGAKRDCVAGPGAALADSFAPGYFPVPLPGHPVPAYASYHRKQRGTIRLITSAATRFMVPRRVIMKWTVPVSPTRAEDVCLPPAAAMQEKHGGQKKNLIFLLQ